MKSANDVRPLPPSRVHFNNVARTELVGPVRVLLDELRNPVVVGRDPAQLLDDGAFRVGLQRDPPSRLATSAKQYEAY